MDQIYIQELFPGFEPDDPLRSIVQSLVVCHADVDRASRVVRLDCTSEHYCPEKSLRELSDAIARIFRLKKLELAVHYPPSELPNMDFTDLADTFIRMYSPAAAILAGAGSGVFSSVEEGCRRLAMQARTVLPDPDRTKQYHVWMEQYRNAAALLCRV